MATTIYDYLLRRKADLEVRMVEAQRRAQLPFEDELKALGLALTAIERAGLAEGGMVGEAASFAPNGPSRRGRKSRSAREMILLVLGKDGVVIPAPDIARQLTRRWGRAIPLAAVMSELEAMAADGLVQRVDDGWLRPDEPREAAPYPVDARISA